MQYQIIIDRFLRSEKSLPYNLSAYEKLILFVLASYMGNKSTCWPSLKSLVKYCSLSKMSLIRHISLLEEKGILKVTRNKNSNNVYEFYPQVVSVRDHVVSVRDHLVPHRYPNNIINNINNKKPSLVDNFEKKKEPKSLVQFWEPGNPDYDRVNKK